MFKLKSSYKKGRKKRRFSKLFTFLIIISVGFIASWGISKYKLAETISQYIKMKKSQNEEKRPIEDKVLPLVKVQHVQYVNFVDKLEAVGTVKGQKDIDLSFQTGALIKDIYFKEGDLVGKGDILGQLETEELEYKVKYQKANYDAAQSTFLGQTKKYVNAEALWRVGAILKSKLDEAVFEAESAALKMKSAEVEWKSAESELKKAEIRAPVDGVVGVIHMDPGEYYNAQNAPKVITLVDIDQVHVEVGVIERDISKVAMGLPARLWADVAEGEEFLGTVVNLLPVIEGKSHTLTVRILVKNEDKILLPGMFIRASIEIFEAKKSIVVPIFCLNKDKDGKYFVNIVDENDIVHSRSIQVGYVSTEYVQILEGLKEGEFVVSEVQQEIKDGDQVQIMEVQETTLPIYQPDIGEGEESLSEGEAYEEFSDDLYGAIFEKEEKKESNKEKAPTRDDVFNKQNQKETSLSHEEDNK